MTLEESLKIIEKLVNDLNHKSEKEKILIQIELLHHAKIAPITWFETQLDRLKKELKELK